jgi:Cdc6-like AAA superfamily ATPase
MPNEVPTSGFINNRIYVEPVPLKRRYRLQADISLTHEEVNDLMTYLAEIGAIRVRLSNSKYVTEMESLLLDVEEEDGPEI